MNKEKSAPPPSAKQERLSDNLSKTLMQFMEGKRYEPMGKIALLKRLDIPKSLYPSCLSILETLIEEGKLALRKNQVYIPTPTVPTLQGILRVHHRGFGFVIPDHVQDSDRDIFIPKHACADAVDGDRVVVEIVPASLFSEKGPEGRVIRITQRGRSHVAGIVQEIGSAIAHVYAPLLGASRPIIFKRQPKDTAKVGDRVILRVITWGKNGSPTVGELCHFLGHISDPSIDVQAAAEEFDLHQSFSPEILREVRKLGTQVKPSDCAGREDLRKLTTFTIDPKTARDYDDALSLHRDKKGHYHLGVHIADVAYYVKTGSYLDEEAKERCNSTYFPGSCIPMLPEELSNHLCSLKARVLRLTVSVLMEFDHEGTLVHSRISRSFIKSKKRYTYEEAKAIIDGKEKSPNSPTLALMVELCILLKKKRRARGSIDFSLSESVIEVDKKGNPLGMNIVEYDISHQLVEEFMLKANEIVATHFSKRGAPLLFRIHEQPDEENLQDFFQLARSLGYSLSTTPTSQDLQLLFEQAHNTPFAHQLAIGFIRSMKLAVYSAANVGHYGLGLENYCHFTSPIRRYSDLVTQRLLFDEESDSSDLEVIAKKCSDQERISFKAETSVKVLKKLRLLNRYFEEDRTRIYEATVTRIKPFGLSFELQSLMLEGFLHISQLGNDYFLYNESRGTLVGRHTGFTYAMGTTIFVRLLSIDFILQESRFEIARTGGGTKKNISLEPPRSDNKKKIKSRRGNRGKR